jgi:mono/diheme cytochrome c family protein
VSADTNSRSALRAALSLTLVLTTMTACDWFTDFKTQPRIEPWEPMSQLDADTLHPPRGNPSFAVPVTGAAAPSYQISYKQLPQTLDSLGALPNPTPVSPASLENGRKLYTINCAVCHGLTAKGDGAATKYGMPGINLTAEPALSRADGYVFGMIRNGRGLMPTYNRIEEMDRWDVVNYLRALQGKVPNATGGTAPYGYPGQNGTTVPGPSQTAPTRPAPMWRAALAAAATPAATPVQGTPTDTAAAAAPAAGARRAADSAQTKRGNP